MSGSFQRIAAVAQSVEQRTENPRVISSILIGGKRGLSKSAFFDNPFFYYLPYNYDWFKKIRQELIPFRAACFSDFLFLFTAKCFLLAVADYRGFFKILPLLPLTNDPLFFNFTFKTFQRFFQRFFVVYLYMSDTNHLPP
jgi:hypothetical protein